VFSTMSEILETHYIESRRNRRYSISEHGTLGSIQVEVRNVSRGGAQVAFAAKALDSRETLDGTRLPFELQVLPALSFLAEVAYDTRHAEGHIVGLKFVEMSAADLESIDRYLFTLT